MAAIGAGAGVGGGILLAIVAYIVTKIKALKAEGKLGGIFQAKAAGNPQNIQTTTQVQGQPGQGNDGPVALNMDGL